MRKKLLLFIIAAIFTFSSMTVLAAEDTADKDAKDKKSAAATIDTSYTIITISITMLTGMLITS